MFNYNNSRHLMDLSQMIKMDAMSEEYAEGLKRGEASVERVLSVVRNFAFPSKTSTGSVLLFSEIQKTEPSSTDDKSGIDIHCNINPDARVRDGITFINIQVKSARKRVNMFIRSKGEEGLRKQNLIVVDGSVENANLEIELAVKINRMLNAKHREHKQKDNNG